MLIPDFRGFPTPQYTRTPNLIFDSLLKDLSGSQLKVLLFFVRATMGWHKDHEFIPAAMARIEEATGLSKQSITDAIQVLEEGRFIFRKRTRAEEGRQGVSVYRLRFTDDTDEEIPESKNLTLEEKPESKNLTLESVNVDSGTDPSFSVFKEISSKENIPLPPSENSQPQTQSPTPEASLDLEDNIVVFTQNAYRRENRRAKLANLQARAHQSLAEALRLAENQWGASEFRSALIAYLDSHDEWLKQNAWPLPAFLKQVARWMPQGCAPDPRPARAATPEVVQPLHPTPGSPARNTALPFAAEEWNRVVTAGLAVESWTKRDGALDSAAADPDFLEALPRVLETCQLAHLKHPKTKINWLNFRWLLRRKDGSTENWYRIASGEMAYLRFSPDGEEHPKPKMRLNAEWVDNRLKELRAEEAAEANGRSA